MNGQKHSTKIKAVAKIIFNVHLVNIDCIYNWETLK